MKSHDVRADDLLNATELYLRDLMRFGQEQDDLAYLPETRTIALVQYLAHPQFKKNRDYHLNNFKTRAHSFMNGAKLLIENMDDDTFKIKKEILIEKLNNLEQQFSHDLALIKTDNDDKHLLEQEHLLLKNFVMEMAMLLEQATDMDAITIGKELGVAERVATWEAGRHPLITISRHQFKPQESAVASTQFVVQMEIPKMDLTEAQKKDYLSVLSAQPPQWFTRMPLWKQNYLKKHLTEPTLVTINTIAERLLTLPTLLRDQPGLANRSEHVLRVYEKKPDSAELTLTVESRRDRSAVVTPVDLYKSEFDAERQRLTDQNVVQVIGSSLADRYVAHCERWNKKIAERPEEATTMTVSYTTLLSPGLLVSLINRGANDNSMMIKNKNAAVKQLVRALEAPNDAENKGYLQLHGLEVSANGAIKVKSSSGKNCWIKLNIVSTNHAVNAWRKVPDPIRLIERKSNRKNVNKLLHHGMTEFLKTSQIYFEKNQAFMNDEKNKWQALIDNFSAIEKPMTKENREQLVEKIATCHEIAKNIRNRNRGSPRGENANDACIVLDAMSSLMTIDRLEVENRNRPLFKACLIQILVDKTGGNAYGSCKSGKDRKGMETLHTDAMLIYQRLHGKLPHYNDNAEDRKIFVEMFVDLYFSRHLHETASQNAPGARGIKEMTNNLPKDILAEINKRSATELEEANKYGGLNKISMKPLKNATEKAALRQQMELGLQETENRQAFITGRNKKSIIAGIKDFFIFDLKKISRRNRAGKEDQEEGEGDSRKGPHGQ